MKSSEEMISSLKYRRDQYVAQQAGRRRTALQSVSVVAVCAVAAGLGIWRLGPEKPENTYTPQANTAITEPTNITEETDPGTVSYKPDVVTQTGSLNAPDIRTDDINHPIDDALMQWEGHTVGLRLYQALSSSWSLDTELYIIARPAIDYEYVYQGKTLAEYYYDMGYERALPEKLTQLLKDGDSLKYGTALYETGTPEDEKWAQSLYEERVAFYGEALLAKYIQDGQFLKEKLLQDIEAAKQQTAAQDAYKNAETAYYKSIAASIERAFYLPGEHGIILSFNRNEFSGFLAEGRSGWSFDLANRSFEPVTDDMVLK